MYPCVSPFFIFLQPLLGQSLKPWKMWQWKTQTWFYWDYKLNTKDYKLNTKQDKNFYYKNGNIRDHWGRGHRKTLRTRSGRFFSRKHFTAHRTHSDGDCMHKTFESSDQSPSNWLVFTVLGIKSHPWGVIGIQELLARESQCPFKGVTPGRATILQETPPTQQDYLGNTNWAT